MSGMPEIVKEQIRLTGAVDANGVTRRARGRNCRRCGTLTLVGLDDDWFAWSVSIELAPLSPSGEAVAIAAGLLTYQLGRWGCGWELNRRDPWRVMTPAGSVERADVVPAHRCGWHWPAELQAPSNFSGNSPVESRSGDPPF